MPIIPAHSLTTRLTSWSVYQQAADICWFAIDIQHQFTFHDFPSALKERRVIRRIAFILDGNENYECFDSLPNTTLPEKIVSATIGFSLSGTLGVEKDGKSKTLSAGPGLDFSRSVTEETARTYFGIDNESDNHRLRIHWNVSSDFEDDARRWPSFQPDLYSIFKLENASQYAGKPAPPLTARISTVLVEDLDDGLESGDPFELKSDLVPSLTAVEIGR